MSDLKKELISSLESPKLQRKSDARLRFRVVARLARESTRLRSHGHVADLVATLRQGTTGLEAVLKLDTVPRKFASGVVYIVMFFASLTLIGVAFRDFFKYEVNTSVGLKDYWRNGSTPPTLTICSVNGFKKSIFCAKENLHITADLCKIRDKTEFAAEYLKFVNDPVVFDELTRIARAASLTISATFKSCVLEGQDCVQQISETIVAPQRYGRCFCLFCEKARKRWIARRDRSPESGLSLVLDSQKEELLPSAASAGFLLLIHDHSIFPDTNLDGLYLGFTRTSYVGIKKKEVQRLPAPYVSACHDDWPEQFRRFAGNRKYSKHLCIKLCTTMYLTKKCGCNLSQRLRFEHLLDSDVFCQETRVTKNCSDEAAQKGIVCPCTLRCTERNFDWRVSHAGWRDTREEDALNVGGLTRLVVYYAKTEREEIKQEPRLKRELFLNLLGGYFGMFVGYSFLIMYELVEIHARWLVSRFNKT